MKTGFSFLITTFLFFSCQNQEGTEKLSPEKAEDSTDKNETPSTEFQSATLTENPSLFENICSVSPMEFTDLYGSIHSISDDAHEKVMLVDTLKKQGFEVKDWGRGNFDLGPRLVSFTLQKDSCKVRVDKLYYSTDTVGTFKVTERISLVK